MEDFVFMAKNNHIPMSGKPPNIHNVSGEYYAYYENCYGEQAVFVYNHDNNTGLLYGGDWEWAHPFKVVDGVAIDAVLNGLEAQWLKVVWNTAMERYGINRG